MSVVGGIAGGTGCAAGAGRASIVTGNAQLDEIVEIVLLAETVGVGEYSEGGVIAGETGGG